MGEIAFLVVGGFTIYCIGIVSGLGLAFLSIKIIEITEKEKK